MANIKLQPGQIALVVVQNLEAEAVGSKTPYIVYESLSDAMSYSPKNPECRALELNGTQVRRLMNQGNKVGTKKLAGISTYCFIKVDPLDWEMMLLNTQQEKW